MTASEHREALRELRREFPWIADVQVEAGKDQTDDSALWIWFILQDSAMRRGPPSDLPSLEEKARSLVWAKDAAVWPYIRFRTVSEQRRIDVAPTLY